MPAPPFEMAELSVSLIAASDWPSKVRPASVTVSRPTGPSAWVPVTESPYLRSTLPPEALKVFETSYGVAVDWRHCLVRHVEDITHRSLDPVSARRA